MIGYFFIIVRISIIFFSSASCEDWHVNFKKSTKYLFHGNVSSIFNEKKTKTEGKFENGKNLKKKKIFAFVEN